jgi:hypothetical protein
MISTSFGTDVTEMSHLEVSNPKEMDGLEVRTVEKASNRRQVWYHNKEALLHRIVHINCWQH